MASEDYTLVKFLMLISYSKLHTPGKYSKGPTKLEMFFRSYSSFITGSKNALKFENILFGNELGSWDGTSFVVPVDGIYIFRLHLATYYSNRTYRLRALINNGEVGIDQLNENTSRYQTYNDYGHTHSFQIEREMQAGDTLTIIDQYSYNTVRDFYEFKCSTNQQEHSCSHITGRLIKRL